ncbi:aldolase/citrate lyase family protein [Marinivivus vitaminiproducens]|uniref:aldolase/citrate lyase family protein n=1 Tax=Marinivivus vitaminiproducens TaxID=3035935 RepID=UPI00279CDC4E|nr:aldolase/citrate lyase family protein [Geminicoccaceae bacterium SCSIO 64248]
MDLPRNTFKHAIAQGRQQVGLWCTLSSPYAAELVAGAGFDWLLFDTEHSPSDIETVLGQLQAVAPYDVSAIVRPASNDPVLIKRLLDIGTQSLLLPYVESADEARAAVASTRYAPEGVRGVSSLTRATRFGRVSGYATRAASEIAVLVQVETGNALANLESIAAVDGVDGVFIGPADLAASLGHPGNAGHPEVKAAIQDGIRRIRACGKPAGILTPDTAFAQECIALGTLFTAVGVDVGILARQAERLAEQFR